ncbi:30S ribosomal protein S20 [Desulfosporosinus metallidurans]|uniref:Small ribosomal subunit protein bS20 n=1 Tax=Desulfosporosinus metallidurans TaxID=1888891 RepID=A0A1Q8QT23_9FIRM|nr:30S ribosomal protein S20 [Desulfosporosinus metallidurans]OLN30505.1 SSU ribosomal protein S20p [Desulfosporosinus metallidurans]
MPNIKSAIKRVELGKARMIKNAAAKSFLRTTIRRFEESVTTDSETAALALKKATRALDKASSKGLIHKNLAARKKSRLTKRFSKHFAQVG